MQDQLADQKKKVDDLKSRGVGPADDDELAQQLQESEEEIQRLNTVTPFLLQSNVENQTSRKPTRARPRRIPI